MKKGVGTGKSAFFAIGGLLVLTPGGSFARPSEEAFGRCVDLELQRLRNAPGMSTVRDRIEREFELLSSLGGSELSPMTQWTLSELRRTAGEWAVTRPSLEAKAAAEAHQASLRALVGPERAQAFIALERRRRTAIEFSRLGREFMALFKKGQMAGRGGIADHALCLKLLSASEDLLRAEGVAFERFVNSAQHEGIRILPASLQPVAPRLSQMATRLKERFGVSLSFVPEELLEDRSKGVFKVREKRVSLSVASLERLGLDATGAHEVNHVAHFHLRRTGQVSPFDFELAADPALARLSADDVGYLYFMHGTEIPAHSITLVFQAFDLRRLILSIREKPNWQTLKQQEEMAHSVVQDLQDISFRMQSLSERSTRHLKEASTRLKTLSRAVEANLENDVKLAIVGFENPRPGDDALRLEVSLRIRTGVEMRFSVLDRSITDLGRKVILAQDVYTQTGKGLDLLYRLRSQLLGSLAGHLGSRVKALDDFEWRFKRIEQRARIAETALNADGAFPQGVLDALVREVLEVRDLTRLLVSQDLPAPLDIAPISSKAEGPANPGPSVSESPGLLGPFQRFWKRISARS
jgi:hypothetical protein